LRRIRAVKPALKLLDARAAGLDFELLRTPMDRKRIIKSTATILGEAR
jgi:hypothetical protein